MAMTSTSYSSAQKSLHWLVFFLVLGLYGITYLEEFFPRGDPGREWIWWFHISFGLLFLAVVVLRLGIRFFVGAPPLPDDTSKMERRLAGYAHLALYALILAVPVIGMFLTWFRGDSLTFFGIFTIPSPVTPNRDIAHNIKELHELGANLILAVAGLHALAALWHQYVRRDDVLRRMLPQTGE